MLHFYTDDEIISEIISYDDERREEHEQERHDRGLNWLKSGSFGVPKELYAVIEEETTIRYGVSMGTIGIYDDEHVANAVADELNRVKPHDDEFFSYSYEVCPLSMNHSPLDRKASRIGCCYIE